MAKLPIFQLPQVLLFVWLTDTDFKVCSSESRIVVCTIKQPSLCSTWSRNWLYPRVFQLTLILSLIPWKAYPKVVFLRLATYLFRCQFSQTTERFLSNVRIALEWVQHISNGRGNLVRYSHIQVSFSSQ